MEKVAINQQHNTKNTLAMLDKANPKEQFSNLNLTTRVKLFRF